MCLRLIKKKGHDKKRSKEKKNTIWWDQEIWLRHHRKTLSKNQQIVEIVKLKDLPVKPES